MEREELVNVPKKVEEIAAALERENPGWSKSRVWATAWETYNRMRLAAAVKRIITGI